MPPTEVEGPGRDGSVAWLRGAADDGFEFDPDYRGPTTLVLLRHGRTPVNAEHRLQGRLDPSLDDVGRDQARSIGAVIRERWNVDRVVTSPMRRARETVDHAGFGDLPTTVDERFVELAYGEYEGRPVKEAIDSLVAEWSRDVEYEPPGGESLMSLNVRIREACEALVSTSPGEVILIATHATPVKAALIWALGGHPRMVLRMHVSQGSLSAVGRTPLGMVVFTYNEQP